jgi:hypothetical protein
MNEAPDPDQLARRYLDLWQQQVTAWLNEPDVADAMAKSYVLMVRGLTALAGAAGLAPSAFAGGRKNDADRATARQDATAKATGGKAPAAGAQAPAASSRDPDRDAAVLARRLAQLEERLARLESAAAAERRPASQRTRQRRR